MSPSVSKVAPGRRPRVTIMMAMTADGKTAPASGLYAPFGSKRDLARLLALRAEADAVMSGARTVNTLPVTLGNSPRHCRARRLRGLPEQPVRIVVSGRGGVDPEAEVFRHRFSPVMVWVTERAPEERVALLRKAGASVKVFGAETVDFGRALSWLWRELGIRHLVCEGGGELNAGLIEAGLADRICVTVCPLLLGGRTAPTIADGAGFERLSQAAPYVLSSMRRAGAELFLEYERAG